MFISLAHQEGRGLLNLNQEEDMGNSDAGKAVRSIRDIAIEINQAWGNVNYAAVPYLSAMHQLDGIDESFGYDSARDVVLRFLGNASSFRGADARRLKQELKDLLGK